jgi:hypothetical protein
MTGGVQIPADERDSDQLFGPQSFLFNGYQASFPVVKKPGSEVDHYNPI